MNLPVERHSHGLRRLAAIEASRGLLRRHRRGDRTDQRTATRQTAGRRAHRRRSSRLRRFYATRQPPAGVGGDVLVLSCDGKGIVMRPDALRPATAAAGPRRPPASWRPGCPKERNVTANASPGSAPSTTPHPPPAAPPTSWPPTSCSPASRIAPPSRPDRSSVRAKSRNGRRKLDPAKPGI